MHSREDRRAGATGAKSEEAQSSSGTGDLRLQLALKRRADQRRTEALGRASSDGGSSLGERERSRFEPGLGSSLGDVRVHTGAASQEAARSIGAKAYTVGNDIHFGAGHYRPGTAEGDRLLAHELVHTRQQAAAGASAVAPKLEVSEPGDASEREADEIADHVVSGRAAGRAQARPPSVARTAEIQCERDPAGPAGGAEAKDANAAQPAQNAPDAKDEKDEKKPEGPIARLEIHADVETVDRTKLTYKELQEARVGHAWISVRMNDPAQTPAQIAGPSQAMLRGGGGTSMGFWPLIHRPEEWDPNSAAHARIERRQRAGQTPGAGASANPAHAGFAQNPFKSYVPGRVEEPDNAHAPKGTKGYDLDEQQLLALMQYVDGKRNAQYSLYFYNCTTFASEAVSAAGHAPPSHTTFGICLPNALYAGIVAMREGGDADATTTPLEEGESETVPKKK